jgi:hypothetical protein
MHEQAVVVRFRCEESHLGALSELEHVLEKTITDAGVGVFDGSDVTGAQRSGSLYMFGPDADALLRVVRPVLESASCLRDPVVQLRSVAQRTEG